MNHNINEVQEMQAKSDDLVRKNKSLRQKNKGSWPPKVIEYLLSCLLCSSTLSSCLQSLRHE
jgi:FtsZ-binding cell division protein ZapB